MPDGRAVEKTVAKPYNAKWNKNEKLAKTSGEEYNIIGFGLPPDYNFKDARGESHNTCPGALACAGVCYAKQGAYNFPLAKAARAHNLTISQAPNFAALVISDLSRMRSIDTVRIHDSGDFYSQEYLNKWADIARALPHLTFYAYTKSLHLALGGLPTNMNIVQSLGGRHDRLVNLRASHSRIFSTHEDRERAGYIDGNIDDSPAIRGLVQIGLVYHGNKNLTASQKKFFA